MSNAARFSGRAEAYERYRARFPPILLARIVDLCGLTPAHVVADIGAGTGMLAELFLAHGNPVVAVEPNDDMRAGCDRLARRFPALSVVAASAENTTLPAASVDLVAVGRAFHWFDRPRAMAEFRRILRPSSSWLVLVTSQWSGDGSPAATGFEDILKTLSLDYHKVLDAQLSEADVHGLLLPDSVHSETLHGEQLLTLDELLGRTLSLSVTPLPGDPRYVPFKAALEAYFHRFAIDGLLRMPTAYRLICGRLPPEIPGLADRHNREL